MGQIEKAKSNVSESYIHLRKIKKNLESEELYSLLSTSDNNVIRAYLDGIERILNQTERVISASNKKLIKNAC